MRIFLLPLICLIVSCSGNQTINELERGFLYPPDSARPTVWWHWLNGNISTRGITLDLEAMAAQGIHGASIFNLKGQAEEGSATFGSDRWQKILTHAFSEAKRLKLDLTLQNCGGWATSGGPWVTPDHAMKKLTFKKFDVSGQQRFKAVLDTPSRIDGYYRDIRVLAFPSKGSPGQNRLPLVLKQVSCDKKILDSDLLYDGDILTEARIMADGGEVSILFEFRDPFEIHSLFMKRTWPSWNGVNNFVLAASHDNKSFRTILDTLVQNSFQSYEFIPLTARYWKITINDGFQDILRIPEIQFNRDIRDFLPALEDHNALAGFQVREKILPAKLLNSGKIAVKLPEVIDLTGNMDENGLIDWYVPEGSWTIMRIGYTLTGKRNEGPPGSSGYESDKLSAQATREFFEGMKEVLLKDREEYTGKTLKTILTDSWECLNLNWTGNFPIEFEKRRGYSLIPYLPAISGELVENRDISYRFLWDFRRTISDLIAENYYGEMARLCHRNGLKLESEAAGAQQAQKDPINYSSRVDIPMTEFWVQPFKPNGSFMDAVSAGHLYDKKIISAESFTSPTGDWQLTPSDLKVFGDQAFCWGINMLRFHSYTHQPDETYPGWQMNPWGIAMNRKMPWWDHVSGYLKYLQRTQYMLQQGKSTADVLLFYSESAQTDLNAAYGNDVLSYLPKGYRFDGCDANTILNRLTVKDHKLVLPDGTAYILLVLPDKLQLSPVVLARISDLIHNGALVYGPKPISSPGLTDYPNCDAQVTKIADEVWGKGDISGLFEHTFGAGKVVYGRDIKTVLNEITIPDFEYDTGKDTQRLDFIHRIYGSADVYFVSNQESHAVRANCKFRVAGKIPELWDPESGSITRDIEFDLRGPATAVPLMLESGSSVFVIFKEPAAGRVAERTKLKGRKPASPEHTIELEGSWQVTFNKRWGGPGTVIFDSLVSWTAMPEEGIRYFSGMVTYEKEFEVSGEWLKSHPEISLDLGEVKETAQVYLNGKEVGILWKKPFQSYISGTLKPGQNRIMIEVANTWPNRIIGDLNSPNGPKYTWSNSTGHYRKDSKLIRSGLFGPVVIRFIPAEGSLAKKEGT